MTQIPIGSTVHHFMYGARMKKVKDGIDADHDSLWKSKYHEMSIPDNRLRLKLTKKDGVLKRLVEAK